MRTSSDARRKGRWVGRGGVASLLAAAVFLVSGSATADPAGDLVVVRSGTTLTVPVLRHHGYPVAPAAALATALGYAFTGESLQAENEQVRFHSGSPFFAVGGEVFQLANPVYRSGPDLMIPLSWALDWLPRRRPLRWRHRDGRLVERPGDAPSGRSRGTPWLVVVDPGHGGKDPGAVGVAGTREKDVTLAIGRALANRLERRSDIRVVLTRDRDTLINLADRPRAAQLRGIDQPPDLFISIHGNSMPRKPNPTRGFETYFLAVAKSEKARQVALRENASLRFEKDGDVDEADLDPLQFILSDLQSTGNLRESSLFAAAIDRSLSGSLPAGGLGVKQAGFYVLVGATMPAALVEVGYLSNRAEEKRLRSSAYQAKIADALADAVVNYLRDYGRRVWSTYSSGG